MRWSPPPEGWVRLNTNSAAVGNPGNAGAGGALRDSEGRRIVSFSRFLGTTTSVAAKLWAVRDGLGLARSMGIRNVEIELGAQPVLDLIRGPWDVNIIALMPLCARSSTTTEGDISSVKETWSRTGLEGWGRDHCSGLHVRLDHPTRVDAISYVIYDVLFYPKKHG